MPTKARPRITAWSYSRWTDYEQCPFKAKCKHVDKLREPPNKAMERGSSIHKDAEDYLLGTAKKLPASLSLFKKEFAELRRAKALPEQQTAFTLAWAETGWFDDDAWLRVKLDALTFNQKTGVARVIDFKTGKQRDDYEAQLELYAPVPFILNGEVRTVETELWYIDQGTIVGGTRSTVGAPSYSAGDVGIFKQQDVEPLKRLWETRTKAMLADTRFTPRPGGYCTYCHFRKANGGPCKF